MRAEQVGGEPGVEPDTTVTADAEATPAEGDEPMPVAAGDAPEGGQRDGRRRSRGGRNRRDRGDREEPRADGESGSGGVTAAESVEGDMAEAPLSGSADATRATTWTAAPVAASYDEAPAAVAEVAPAADPVVAEAAPEPVAVAVPQPVRMPEPAPIVVAASAAVAAPAPLAASFVLETDALQAVAEGAGLQWVNSDAEKIRAAQQAMADEAKPAHVAREPKPVAAIDDGPLVLVETRRDLSQVKLPFEAQDSTPPAA